MDEEQWLSCDDPEAMLDFVRGRVSQRKLRLFAAACCRRVWHLLIRDASKNAVEFLERLADGNVSESARAEIHAAAYRAAGDVAAYYRGRRGTESDTTSEYREAWKHARVSRGHHPPFTTSGRSTGCRFLRTHLRNAE
jgi:hypothetical protein